MNAIDWETSAFSGKQMLVVDDSPSMRELLRQTLYDAGFERVHCAASGAQALTLLGNATVDMMICDSMMEPVDGLALIRQLRGHGDYDRLPILLITGHAERSTVEQARKAGVTDILVKPLSRSLLLRRLAAMQPDGSRSEAAPSAPRSVPWNSR
ncbi:MAG: response regulator [Acetobacterales bacterium]